MLANEAEVFQKILRTNCLGLDSPSMALNELKQNTNFKGHFFLPVSEYTEAALAEFFPAFEKDLRMLIKRGFDDDLAKISKFLKVPEVNDPVLRHLFDLNRPQFLARPDFLWSKQGLRMIEQNISSAVGGMSQILKMLRFAMSVDPICQQVARANLVFRDPVRAIARHLRSAGVAHIFALDVDLVKGSYWDDTLIELEKVFLEEGIHLIELFPELISFCDGRLTVGDTRIEHVLRLAVTSNVFDRATDLRELINDRSVHWHGNLNEIIFWNKLWLAFFSDQGLRREYGIELNRDYSDWIPWSRLVRESVTEFQGKSVSLIDLLIRKKDLFVVKRGNGWLTKAVHFGLRFSESAWRAFIKRALSDGDWMVQEFLEGIPIDTSFNGEEARCNIILSPYFIGKEIVGYMVRTPGNRLSGDFGPVNGLTTAFCYRNSDELL